MDSPLAEAVQLPDLLGKRILLVITGGIAAYKSLELIRLLRKSGASVRAVLTKAGAEFVTPLSVVPWNDSALEDYDAIILLDVQPTFAYSPLPPNITPTAVIDHHTTRGRKPI